MDNQPLDGARREALLCLLDDPSPSVRGALQAYFLALGPAAASLLQETANGSNRILAWHARRYLEELRFTDPVAEFREFIRAQQYDLESGSLLLSRTVNPQVDTEACVALLDGLAARCRELIVEPGTAREKCRVINRVLFHESGFRGNVEDYTDPNNSFLDQVLTRRRGIPVSLSIVYLLVARRLVRGPLLTPVVGAVALASWDLFLDPQMVAWGVWRWDEPGAYFGIPLLNFAGWLLVAALITLAARPRDLPRRPLLAFYVLVAAIETVGLLQFWGLAGPADRKSTRLNSSH